MQGRIQRSDVQRNFLGACPLVSVLRACEEGALEDAQARRVSPVESIQHQVAAADLIEGSYYAVTYRKEEPCHWNRFPGWITEDALESRFMRAVPATRILDLGCGYGTMLAFATMGHAASGVRFDVMPYIQPAIQERYGIE